MCTLTNFVQVEGQILANGGSVSADWGGGGSGGSIWIDAGILTGGHTGNIQVTGGSVFTSLNGGGGAGGRIAVYYNNTIRDAFYNGTFDSYGGKAGMDSESGASGTVYLKHRGRNFSQLIVDNKGMWTMETDIINRGRRLELYKGGSGGSRTYTANDVNVTSSCNIVNTGRPYYYPYSISYVFDQSYKKGYANPYFFTYICDCNSGSLTITLKDTFLVNHIRIFPVRGTDFQVCITLTF